MEKRMSILEEIYNGKICPIEDIIPESADYRPLSEKISAERKYFSTKLLPADKERFEKWNSLISKYQLMTEYANFSYGFKMGLLLAFELLAGKEIE